MNAQNIEKTEKASFFEEAFFNAQKTYIHPSAVIGENVSCGEGVKIGPNCIILGNVTIGAGTRIYANVIIGLPAQVLGLSQNHGSISIGARCELREFVTVHAPRSSDGKTVIGDDAYIMCYSHISHDCIIENNVTLVNNVQLGGHTHVEKHAFLMACAATHQFCRIGQFTALAPFSATRQDLPPFSLFTNQPAAFSGLNLIALKRSGMNRETINAIKHAAKLFYQDKLPLAAIKELAQSEPTWGSDSSVTAFLSFIENSTRGVSRKALLQTSEEEVQPL